MRYIRYFIAILLVYITCSTYVMAISSFYPDNIFPLLQTVIPITVLDLVLIWVYTKGILIYGTNIKKSGRLILILSLLLLTLIAFVYSFIQKTEADIAKATLIEYEARHNGGLKK